MSEDPNDPKDGGGDRTSVRRENRRAGRAERRGAGEDCAEQATAETNGGGDRARAEQCRAPAERPNCGRLPSEFGAAVLRAAEAAGEEK